MASTAPKVQVGEWIKETSRGRDTSHPFHGTVAHRPFISRRHGKAVFAETQQAIAGVVTTRPSFAKILVAADVSTADVGLVSSTQVVSVAGCQ